jgi:hypothetical protein
MAFSVIQTDKHGLRLDTLAGSVRPFRARASPKSVDNPTQAHGGSVYHYVPTPET